MISYLLFLTGLSCADGLLAFLFPYDTSYITMSFVPSLAFIGLALISRKIDLKQSMSLTLVFGLYQDLFVNQTVFIYTVVYIAVILIARLWSKSISSSIFESVLFAITTLFVKEIVLYFLMTITNTSYLGIFQWFLKREFLTLVLHCFCGILVVWLLDKIQLYLENQDAVRRKGENVKWLQLRLREEKKQYKS